MVDPNLYDFLKENETGIYKNKNDEIIAYVFITFDKIVDFVKIVDAYTLDEGGHDCMLKEDCICIDINDFIEGDGCTILDYKNCFNEEDINRYEEELKKVI